MSVTHATVPFDQWSDVPAWLDRLESCPFLYCPDAPTPMALAAWLSSYDEPLRAWITIDEDHPASLAARDIKTLSMLVRLHDVMISSADGRDAIDAAQLIALLLSEDDVSASNSAGTIRGAWNRPRPPRSLSLWVTSSQPANATVIAQCVYRGRERVNEVALDSRRVDVAT